MVNYEHNRVIMIMMPHQCRFVNCSECVTIGSGQWRELIIIGEIGGMQAGVDGRALHFHFAVNLIPFKMS